MDDKFLHDQRRDPDPAFARDLRDRLRRIEEPQSSDAAVSTGGRCSRPRRPRPS
jgi:hypothetical protein